MKGMGAEGHPGITMQCFMSAALQRHDDILVKRRWVHGALCRMKGVGGQAEHHRALWDISLQSGIVERISVMSKRSCIVNGHSAIM